MRRFALDLSPRQLLIVIVWALLTCLLLGLFVMVRQAHADWQNPWGAQWGPPPSDTSAQRESTELQRQGIELQQQQILLQQQLLDQQRTDMQRLQRQIRDQRLNPCLNRVC